MKGISLGEIGAYINETALFRNQWQFRPENGETDPEFKDRVRAVLRDQLAVARKGDLLVPQVVYGYFPVNADGDELIVWADEQRGSEAMRFAFPRQDESPWLCIADFFRHVDTGDLDYAAFHIVTMGERISERTAELFAADQYQDYLYLHGLGVEMAEALAEYWHHRIRTEWGSLTRTARRCTACSVSSTAVEGIRGGIRRVPIWRTTSRSLSCSTPRESDCR